MADAYTLMRWHLDKAIALPGPDIQYHPTTNAINVCFSERRGKGNFKAPVKLVFDGSCCTNADRGGDSLCPLP